MIPAESDLLIAGGLAMDHLADGSTVAGGSVMHAARAAAAAGRRVATITAAGPEPEAVAAVAELAALGPIRVTPMAASIHYAIHETPTGRRLVLLAAGGDLRVTGGHVVMLAPRAVLIAPIAGELSAQAIRACARVPVRVAALQGWLRWLVPGEEARPLSLAALGSPLSTALGELDGLVASDEDLAGVGARPQEQLAALRAHLGPRPALFVTVGVDGAWLDDPATGVRHLPAAPRLDGILTVGAGDAFAALLAIGLGVGIGALPAAMAAIAGTADYLAARA